MKKAFVWTALLGLATSVAGAAPATAGGFGRHCGQTDRATTRVMIKDLCYSPTVVRVAPGETVTWINQDAEPHTVTAPGNWGGDHTEYLRGEDVSFTFEEEGTFPYVCLVHPGMVGVVVVGDGVGTGDSAGAAAVEAGSDSDAPGKDPGPASDSNTGRFVALGVLVAILLGLGLVFGRGRFGAPRMGPVEGAERA
ncbi:MAG: plastocyanin/azurin family copper-binding protein [Actinomycetota bacterium]|nr:plastocyanin/azurin family copper-binding protein [Actinomycetota bacterium]